MVRKVLDPIIEEYKEKWFLYHDFCVTLNNLLIHLLKDRNYKYQISHRVKAIGSLRRKLAEKNGDGSKYRKLSDIEDVAGIRIVFYLERDKKRFIADLFEEFTAQNLKLKEIHKRKGYRATHVRATFGRKRLVLMEYKRFRSLKCEIQLTSALYHAWSEIEHDIFYKPNLKIGKRQRKKLEDLRSDLEKAMTDHIERASDLFELVIEKIKSAGLEDRRP